MMATKMKKDSKSFEIVRPFRLAHQALCITSFNFETESLIGYVEMNIYPLKPDLKRVKINSKQCCIYRVSINDMWEADFTYNDPALEICQGDARQRNLDYFQSTHFTSTTSVDPDWGNGELTIKIPSEAMVSVQELKPFRICIEFSLERPKGGIKFVVPDMDGTMLDRGAHLFSCKNENSARLWFPCVDSFSEVCTWKLEFTVDMYLTAVSCGDLIETMYTADLRKKTYHYYLSTPTAAPNIALAVGPFEVFVDPHMHEVTHFCLPHLLPLLKQSTTLLYEAFEFYEELLSSRYPYTCYKQVFVDQTFDDVMAYATMTIFSTNMLHSKKIIDQVPTTRLMMASAIARQFFGCYISMFSWNDAWLPKGIAAYLTSQYKKKAFGNNEYRCFVHEEVRAVQDYEQSVGGIVLDPSAVRETLYYFSARHPHTASPKYVEMHERKAHLVMRMVEIRIGRELLLQVLNKMLALATNAASQKFTSNTWINMLLSTNSFLKCIATVTGKDIQSFIDQWVTQGGFAKFQGSFVFNRKRNVVELELKQDWTSKGTLKYVGPLTVAIQELDGTFSHTFQIEENKTKFEITCHSKSRRHKKKKIPLSTGEEVDMDLNDTDADSPVLWLRVDPEITIFQQTRLEQADWMWQYQLRYERCVCAQLSSIRALLLYTTAKTRLALTDIIENEKCFYRIRMEAATCLAKIANAMVSTWAGPPAMMTIFRKMFSSHACPSIVRQNNFNSFQHYFLQKTIPFAMAQLRTVHNICPPEVLSFIFDLFKYNDNSRNRYSDNYYRASLIDALAETVTPAVTMVTVTGMGPSTDAVTEETKSILEEITRYLNMEKLLPCYKLVITVSCLKAIRKLQRFGHLPSDATIFKSYALAGNFIEVRMAALEALVDFTKVDGSSEILYWILEMAEEDSEPQIRHGIFRMLIENPPFGRREESPLSTDMLVERIWRLMNSAFAHNSRLRCDAADLYYTLYGRTRPPCLPIPESVMVLKLKEGRTYVNPEILPDLVSSERETDMSQEQIDVETPALGADAYHSLKRKADSPLSPQPYRAHAAYESAIFPETDDSNQGKVRIKSNSSSLALHTLDMPRSPKPPSPMMDQSEVAYQSGVDIYESNNMIVLSESVPPAVTSVTVMDTSQSEDLASSRHAADDTFQYSRPGGVDDTFQSTQYSKVEDDTFQSSHYSTQAEDSFQHSQYSKQGADDTFHHSQSSRQGADVTFHHSQTSRQGADDTFHHSQSSRQGADVTFQHSQQSRQGADVTFQHSQQSRQGADDTFQRSQYSSASESNSIHPSYKTESVDAPLPTSFDSSMFPVHGSERRLEPPSQDPAPVAPGQQSDPQHKAHKQKKKKKKNKHKHKHKHKHDREKSDERREKSDERRERFAEFLLSSGASNTNSPAVHLPVTSPVIQKPPDSPEFEVI